MNYAPPLIPPFRYSIVEESLYRGGYPTLKNFRFLRRLRLKTIVSLIEPGSEASRDLQEFCEHERVSLEVFHVKKFDDHVEMPQETAAAVVSRIINADKLPLFIHCRDGSHNTGLVIMLLRRLQNWHLRRIYDEFAMFVKTNDLTREETVYLESFKATITVPQRIPSWLWQGIHIRSHPVVKMVRAKADSQAGERHGGSDSRTGYRPTAKTKSDVSGDGSRGALSRNLSSEPLASSSDPGMEEAPTWEDLAADFQEAVLAAEAENARRIEAPECPHVPARLDAILICGVTRRKPRSSAVSSVLSGLALEGNTSSVYPLQR